MRPYRKQKVANAVRHIVSEAIVRRLNDPRVGSLTTVTRVEVTGDLSIARVFLSVQGGDAVESRTLAAMQNAAGYIQRMLARELSLRQCPELRFEIDEAAKRTRQTMDLLAENRRNEPEIFEPEDAQSDACADLDRLSGDVRDGVSEEEAGAADPIRRPSGATEEDGDEA